MWRKSSNNGWVPQFLNSAAVPKIGGDQVGPGQRFAGQLGNLIVCNNGDALKLSNVNGVGGGTLYEGVYQLVRFAAAVTTVVRGHLLFWNTLALNGQATYEVTTTASAANASHRAGVALFDETAAGSKYAYIQVAGLSQMKYAAAAVGALGALVIQATAVDTPLLTVATVNTFADATQAGTLGIGTLMKSIVGTAYETPSNNGVHRVWMNQFGFYPNASS